MWLESPTADRNALCAGWYEPETAITREAGFLLEIENLLHRGDLLFTKLTYFDIRVAELLESIYQNTRTGAISQPGREVRKGFEFELRYDAARWFASLAVATLDGYVSYGFFADNANPDVARFGDPGKVPLFNVNGDSVNLTTGLRPATRSNSTPPARAGAGR